MKRPDERSEKEKMLAGDLERTAGPELAANHRPHARLKCNRYQHAEQHRVVLSELVGAVGNANADGGHGLTRLRPHPDRPCAYAKPEKAPAIPSRSFPARSNSMSRRRALRPDSEPALMTPRPSRSVSDPGKP